MGRLLALSVAILVAGSTAYAQDHAGVEAVDAKRVEALKQGNGSAWGETINDNCIWVNMATGAVEQNKAERVKNISESGGLDIQPSTDVEYHTVANNRIVQTGKSARSGRFARVYTRSDNGGWRMVALYQENVPSQ